MGMQPVALTLTINGVAQTFTALDSTDLVDGAAFSVAHLLERLHLTGKRVAVEMDGQLVPRSRHATTVLHDGMRLEIVHAVGGG